MKIPYFIAPVLLNGNHSNTDYLLGRQLMHISKSSLTERERENTANSWSHFFCNTLFGPARDFSSRPSFRKSRRFDAAKCLGLCRWRSCTAGCRGHFGFLAKTQPLSTIRKYCDIAETCTYLICFISAWRESIQLFEASEDLFAQHDDRKSPL